ncbi:hypothetical protein EXIGLDRAFT_725346, partial [Exidia glandulosa HHB12029]
MFFDAAYECIYVGVTLGEKAIALRSKPNQGFNSSKRGEWPLAIDSMFPSGESESIASHVFWCTQLFSPYPTYVLCQLVVIARPIVLPIILREPLHGQLMWSLVQELDPFSPTPVEHWLFSGGRTPCTLPSDWKTFRWLTVKPRLAPFVAGTFLHFLHKGPDSGYDDSDRFLRGYERAMWPAVKSACSELRSQGERGGGQDLIQGALDGYAVTLHEALKLPESELDPALLRLANALPSDNDEENIFTIAIPIYMYLKRSSNLRACFGPGCGMTMQRNEGKPFQVCSGCKVVRYCSKACQKRDWSEDRKFPHKETCPVFRRLLAQPGITLNCEAMDFQKAFFQPDVHVDDQDLHVLLMSATDSDIPKEIKFAVMRIMVPNINNGAVNWAGVRAAKVTKEMVETLNEWMDEQSRARRSGGTLDRMQDIDL